MLLVVVLVAHSSTIKVESQIVGDMVSRVRLRAGTDAVIHYLAAQQAGADETFTAQLGQWNSIEFAGQTFSYRVVPEDSYLSLNGASLEQITYLLDGLLEEDLGLDAQYLAGQIIDWRDADDLTLTGDSEAAQYRSAGYDYTPANEGLKTPQELLRILDFTPEMLSLILPFISVVSNHSTLNAQYAAAELLELVPVEEDAYGDDQLDIPVVTPPTEGGITFDNMYAEVVVNYFRIAVAMDKINSNHRALPIEVIASFMGDGAASSLAIKHWNEYATPLEIEATQITEK